MLAALGAAGQHLWEQHAFGSLAVQPLKTAYIRLRNLRKEWSKLDSASTMSWISEIDLSEFDNEEKDLNQALTECDQVFDFEMVDT